MTRRHQFPQTHQGDEDEDDFNDDDDDHYEDDHDDDDHYEDDHDPDTDSNIFFRKLYPGIEQMMMMPM